MKPLNISSCWPTWETLEKSDADDQVQMTSSEGPQAGNRCWGVKDRLTKAAGSVLDDEEQRAYVLAVKRLLSAAKEAAQ